MRSHFEKPHEEADNNGAYRAALARQVREAYSRGDEAEAGDLFADLVACCMPMFIARSHGLARSPELREDAIQSMIEQLLRELRDPREQSPVTHFSHYLWCLCADNFGNVLRQEGLDNKRESYRNANERPHHVPRNHIDSLDQTTMESGVMNDASLAYDPIAAYVSDMEARRILDLIPNPRARSGMAMHVVMGYNWDEVAYLLGVSEKTSRRDYDNAKRALRSALDSEVDTRGEGLSY